MKEVTAAPVSENPDYHKNIRSETFSLIPRCTGTLADIGGGIGNTAARLKALGYAKRVGVVDLFQPPAGGPALDFSFGGDLEDQAFLNAVIAAEGPFDTILCFDVLEHLVDPWAVVARLHQGLKPGGVIVASLPNVRNYSVIVPLLLKNKWELQDSGILDRTHLRFFVRDSAIALLTSSGLVLEEVRANPNTGWKIRWFRRLTFGLMNNFFDNQYLIRVRRPSDEVPRPLSAQS